MATLKKWFKGLLGTVALFLFLVVAVIWVYIFITNLQLAGVLKQVILPIIDLIFMGAIGKLFWKKFQRYYRETQNFSSTLVKFIGDEWVIQVSVWALILITSIHLIRNMPVYKVVVNIEQSADYVGTEIPHSIPWELRPSHLIVGIPMLIKVESVDQPLELFLETKDSGELDLLERPDTTRPHFESRRLLRWGQKTSVIVKTKQFVKIIVRTEPESAKVWVKKLTGDSILCALGVCFAEKGGTFKIRATAAGYVDKETHPFAGLERDTIIDVSLEQEKGSVSFNINLISGQPVADIGLYMDVYVDGKPERENYHSRDRIRLTQGRHSIYMEKEYGDEKYWVDKFDIQIQSSQDTAITCRVRNAPIPP